MEGEPVRRRLHTIRYSMGAGACQRTTNAVCHIHSRAGHSALCHINDFVGVAPCPITAQAGFKTLRHLLNDLGLREALEKATPPTTRLTWIGVEFDTELMEMRIPEQKVKETLRLVREWALRQSATRLQLQSLLGKLLHISQCVKPARLFVSRMLETLRSAPPTGYAALDPEFQRDIDWFLRFLPSYNGIHLINTPVGDEHVELDSCLSGCGAIYRGEYYHEVFPEHILAQNMPICQLEMLNIVVASRTWAPRWRDKTIIIY